MIVHPGSLKHKVEPLISGYRYNLILWCYFDDTPSIYKGVDDVFVVKKTE